MVHIALYDSQLLICTPKTFRFFDRIATEFFIAFYVSIFCKCYMLTELFY